jgi:hypothetical protein
MITALWILVGLQLAQFACTVVLVLLVKSRHKARKILDAKNNEMVLHIMESRLAPERGFNPWVLFEPGSVNHPARKRRVDRFKTALGALEYADAIYPGVRVEITDVHYEIIPPEDVRDGTRIEAS